MRIVLDTNVFFAALVARSGLCAQVVEECLTNHDLFVSQFILSELDRVLREKTAIDSARIQEAIGSISVAKLVEPTTVEPTAVRDPNDAAILGTALASRAELIVSGDKDLIVLGSFQSIPIVSPRQFYDRFLSQ